MAETEINTMKEMQTDVDNDLAMCFARTRRKFTSNVVYDELEISRAAFYTTKEMQMDVDDDLAMCFARKRRIFTSNVVDDDYLMDVDEELEISRAALVEVDGRSLKEIDEYEYNRVLCFASNCRKKISIQLFRYPGDPRMSILGSHTLQTLRGEGCELAVIAIKEYQKINKNVKLKLRDLMRINFDCDGRTTYFMTFSAEDEKTREIKTYQAALTEYFDGHLLGLFRNIVDDKVLAILSVKGTKEELRQARFEGCVKKVNRKKRYSSKHGGWVVKKKRDEKPSHLYSVEKGEVDISGSALVEVECPNLKEMDLENEYYGISFAKACRQKHHLKVFHRPADPKGETGGMGTIEGERLISEGHEVAITAIEEYQKVKQNVKLKLRDLMKYNYFICDSDYITFSAEDEMTGEVKTYQAALTNDYDNGVLLGLFRDLVDDKILAILSVKGSKEDLAADEDEYWRMLEERPAQEE